MASGSVNHAASAPLSNSDIAVLAAMRLQKALESGESFMFDKVLQFPRNMLRPVRPHMADDETMLVSSQSCLMDIWGAPGDGSYDGVGVPTIATGMANRTGLYFAAGAALGSIAGTMRNKRRAEKDMVARWMPFTQAPLTVSTRGIYLETPDQGLLYWNWDVFDSMELQAPSCLVTEMAVGDESFRARLTSDWSELIFISWVEVCFPQHPGKYNFVPDGWRERVIANTGIDPYTEPAITA